MSIDTYIASTYTDKLVGSMELVGYYNGFVETCFLPYSNSKKNILSCTSHREMYLYVSSEVG